MEIKVSNRYAIIDEEDFDRVSQHRWYYQGGYAITRINNRTIYMHRLILNSPKGFDTDHINHNKLDNRKTNLRICTRSQNRANNKVRKNNTSGYKGVYWYKPYKKWMVAISINGVQKTIGYYSDKLEAAKIYNKYAIEYFGDFAFLNSF